MDGFLIGLIRCKIVHVSSLLFSHCPPKKVNEPRDFLSPPRRFFHFLLGHSFFHFSPLFIVNH
jgi:hypothetical protein